MITNTAATIIVDGVNSASVFYKRSEEEIVESQICGVGENGRALGAGALVITDEIKGYFIKPIFVHKSAVYNLSGVVTPGDKFVHLSVGFVKGSIDALKNNIIATTYADAEGNFTFSNIACPYGVISLWTTHLAQDATTASTTYELSTVSYSRGIGDLTTYSFSQPTGQIDNPLFTITGTCSEDIQLVYVSCAEDATNMADLMDSICSLTIPTDGAFKLECSGSYNENYVVWGLSKRNGSIAVSEVKVTNNFGVCLSGDTMITMADGSARRMDSLCAGDVVLSDKGVSSRIHTIRRGHFSDHHTLYHFEDGTIIDETHPHRFYNVDQGFWQRLQLWNIGDHAINQDGKMVALVSVEHLDEKAEMFGIWTDSGTYYANGLLSGAASCNKELLAEATAEQAIDMMLSTDEEMLIQLMGLEGVLP